MGRDVRDEFAVDECGVTSEGYHSLVPASRKSMYVGKTILLVVSAVILILFSFYLPKELPGFETYARIAPLLLLAMVAIYCLIAPVVFYRRYRYRIDEDKVDILKGVIYISHSMVPVERIHQVEVVRGPINRAFGLANVTITTAGGNVVLEYLEESVAEEIASILNEKIIIMLRSRDR